MERCNQMPHAKRDGPPIILIDNLLYVPPTLQTLRSKILHKAGTYPTPAATELAKQQPILVVTERWFFVLLQR